MSGWEEGDWRNEELCQFKESNLNNINQIGIKSFVIRGDWGMDDITRFVIKKSSLQTIKINLDSPFLWKISYQFGTGFRVPRFSDLFWPAGVYVQGNPDLLPEFSDEFRWRISLYPANCIFFEIEHDIFSSSHPPRYTVAGRSGLYTPF